MKKIFATSVVRALSGFRARDLDSWFRLLRAWSLKLKLYPQGSVRSAAARKLPTVSLRQVTDPQVDSRLPRFAQTKGVQATFPPYRRKSILFHLLRKEYAPSGREVLVMCCASVSGSTATCSWRACYGVRPYLVQESIRRFVLAISTSLRSSVA